MFVLSMQSEDDKQLQEELNLLVERLTVSSSTGKSAGRYEYLSTICFVVLYYWLIE